jgi:ATP-dependent DNA helicase RecG
MNIADENDLEEWIANVSRNNLTPAINPVIQPFRINDKTIYIVEVPKGQHKPYQTIDGKYWIRVGSTNRIATQEELMRLFQQSGLVHFDISPVDRAYFESLDRIKLHDYWSTFYQVNYADLAEQEQIQLLLNSDILVENNGQLQVSVSGNLIFGKEPQRYLPQSSIVFAVFKGPKLEAELLDKKEITGSLPELIDRVTALIQLFIPKPSTIIDLKREETILIPAKIIRETLVNAVCHRDYSISGQRIMVFVFSDRIEIKSPGRLTNTLTIEKIKTGNSSIRNQAILKYLDNMRYIDALGRGIPMIINEMHERAVFAEIGEMFSVTLIY